MCSRMMKGEQSCGPLLRTFATDTWTTCHCHRQVEAKLASVRQGDDAELEHSGHAAQQRLAVAAAALLVRVDMRRQCHAKLA